MKLKNIVCAVALSAAVVMGMCGCGNEKSREEVYELLGRVEVKANKIEEARLNMGQGFQEKWDLLKRKQSAANRAFSKNDYDTTSKFLQEAEFAADWIMEKAPQREEADKAFNSIADNRKSAEHFGADEFATELYQAAQNDLKLGIELYSMAKFVEAKEKFESAASTFKKSYARREAVVKDMIASMVKVEAGSFNMGSEYAKPVHRVTLTKDFLIGKYEVTQRQWKAVMGNNPSYFKGDNRPVEKVNWHDAMAFCKKLNDSGKAPKGWKFTLPTEAQWEFAARGGNKSKGYEYSGSNDLKEVGWYDNNSDGKTHNVGGKKPNELGIYDMSGNVWEWCLDWYGVYGSGAVTDPQGLERGSGRVLRGGSWRLDAFYCRSARRISVTPDDWSNYYGFRVALVPVQ